MKKSCFFIKTLFFCMSLFVSFAFLHGTEEEKKGEVPEISEETKGKALEKRALEIGEKLFSRLEEEAKRYEEKRREHEEEILKLSNDPMAQALLILRLQQEVKNEMKDGK